MTPQEQKINQSGVKEQNLDSIFTPTDSVNQYEAFRWRTAGLQPWCHVISDVMKTS